MKLPHLIILLEDNKAGFRICDGDGGTIGAMNNIAALPYFLDQTAIVLSETLHNGNYY